MNIITRYRERRAAEKALEVEMQKLAHDEQLKQIQRDIHRAEMNMFSRPCPFTQGGNCQAICVHFTPGRGAKLGGFGEVSFYQHDPKCKLWRT